MLCNRWNGDSVVRFLAFGAKDGYFHSQILNTLDEEFPSWKTEFAWKMALEKTFQNEMVPEVSQETRSEEEQLKFSREYELGFLLGSVTTLLLWATLIISAYKNI